MTKFNPENKEILTYGECLEPAMQITDPEDAKQYKKDYIDWVQKSLDKEPDPTGKTAEQIVNSNLGYFAGYYSNEVRARVEKLFLCEHPIFGSIEKNGTPTPKQAFEMGLKKAEELKKDKGLS